MSKVDVGSEMVHRGPVKNRSCTDVFCLIIFIAFLVGWGIIGFYGFTLGDPQRLLHPTDSNGRICGVDETLKDKPYLFYFDLTRCADPSVLIKGCSTPQICVKKCPTENFLAIAAAAQIGEALTKTKLICKENVTVSQMSVKELVDKGHCASYYLQSEPIAGHCLPSLSASLKAAHAKIQKPFGTKQQEDMVERAVALLDVTKVCRRFICPYVDSFGGLHSLF